MNKYFFITFLIFILWSKDGVYYEPKSKLNSTEVKNFIKEIYDPIKAQIETEHLFGDNEKIEKLVAQHIKEKQALKKIPQAPIAMIQRLIVTALTHDIKDYAATPSANRNPEDTAEFMWCLCGGPEERIFFTLQLIHDTLDTYKDKKKPLVYTSLGSGWLLHDFLNVQELIEAGYENIFVNIVDVEYPDDTLIPKNARDKIATLQDIQHQKNERTRKVLEAQEHAGDSETHSVYEEISGEQQYLGHPLEAVNIIDKFTLEITKWISFKKKKSVVHVQHFTDAYDYINRIERKPELKSDIIVLIDPDGPAIYEISDENVFPSRANVILASINYKQNSEEVSDSLYIFLPVKSAPITWRTINTSEQVCFTKALETLLTNFPAKKSRADIYNEVKRLFENNCKSPDDTFDINWASSAHLALFDIIAQTAQPTALIYSILSTNEEREPAKIHRYYPKQPSVKKFIDDTIGFDLRGMKFKEVPYTLAKENTPAQLLEQTMKTITALWLSLF